MDGAPPPPPPLPPDADDEVPPRQAAAELRSGLSGVEVAPRGLAMGRLRGVEARCEGAGDASGDGGERRIVCGRLVQAGSRPSYAFFSNFHSSTCNREADPVVSGMAATWHTVYALAVMR